MAINAESIWKSSLVTVVNTADATWATNLASWINTNSSNMKLITCTGAVFTFNSSVFVTNLLNLVVPQTTIAQAAQYLADAWSAAISSSSLNVIGGIQQNGGTNVFGSCTPMNLSTVKTNLIASLITNSNVTDILNSTLGPDFRNAFLGLTYSFSGTYTPVGGVPPITGFAFISGVF